MAKSKNPSQDSILAAPFAAVPPVAPRQNEAALKGSIVSRYSGAGTSKADKPDLLAMAAPIVTQQSTESVEETATRRFRQQQLMQASVNEITNLNFDTWLQQHTVMLGEAFDKDNPIDNAFARFRQANSNDQEITAAFEAREYAPYVHNPRLPSTGGNRRTNSPREIIDDGFNPPVVKLSPDERRTNLAASIKTVSEMYAGEAGLSAKDFAHVMGGIATIESRFGVLREVKGTKYASSAGGAYHYLNGTIAGEVRNNMDDPRIAQRVKFLGVDIKNGVSKSEAWTLKEDDILAGSVLAKRIVETVRKNPELAKDIDELTTRVYQSHNLGDAGASRLARGGLSAMTDKEKANNPMFFRGATSDDQVQNRYEKFVSNAIDSSANFINEAFLAPEALASARQQPKVAAAAPKLPERAPA